jgi:WD40 repeat protein
VCGYLDNSVRVFDLEAKPGSHWVATIKDHRARVTCLKLSGDNKYLISGDSDGVILHYG